MAWIEKRAKGQLVRWRELDGTPASKMAATLPEARLLKAEVEAELLKGSYVARSIRQETFGAFAQGILDGSLDLEESTRQLYAGTMRKWILPHLGDLTMEQIEQRRLRAFFGTIAAAGASPATQSTVRRLLSKILTQAVSEGVYPRSPLRGISIAKTEERDIVVLTPSQVSAVAEALPPRYRLMAYLAAYGQLRFGEVCGLHSDAIDHENDRIHVRRAQKVVGSRIYVGPPKSAAGRRTVTLPDWLMKELVIQELHFAVDGWLFRTEAGAVIQRGRFHEVWRAALAAAGFTEPWPRFHDLRHTGVSLLIKQGWNPRAIMKRVGHSKIAMTLETYGHLFPGDEEAMAAGLEEFAPRVAEVKEGPWAGSGSSSL